MILDPNGMPILQPTIDNAETATFNDAFAAVGEGVNSTVASAIEAIPVHGTMTIESGYTFVVPPKLVKTGKLVVLTFRIEVSGAGDLPAFTTLATVPTEFRITNNLTVAATAVKSGVSDYIATVLIKDSGGLQLARVEGGASANRVGGSISWVVD